MTTANIDVPFGKNMSSLTLNGRIIAQGEKANNLFTYVTIPVHKTTKPTSNQTMIRQPDESVKMINYANPADITLWHHRLAHTGYSTLEAMN